MKIFARIRFYWGAFIISFIIAVFTIPLITIFPKYKGIIMHKLNVVIIFLMGGKVEQVGEADDSANLILMNHQGVIDVIGMEALQGRHHRWVAKKELFDATWFGHLLRNGDMISIDRNNKVGLLQLVKDVTYTIKNTDRAVIIFPEGTRASGQKLLPFKAGAKFIAKKLNMRIQVIVIIGSKKLLNEHIRTGGNATVKYIYLPAFDVKDAPKDWYEHIKVDMQKVIDDELSNNNSSR